MFSVHPHTGLKMDNGSVWTAGGIPNVASSWLVNYTRIYTIKHKLSPKTDNVGSK